MSKKKRPASPPPQPAAVSDAAPAGARPARSHDRFFLAVLALAALTRILFLGRAELWQDELGFVNLSRTALSLGEIWRQGWDLIVTIGQLPLSFMIFNACYRVMELFTVTVSPFTPGLARVPSVIFGVLGVWSAYRLSVRVLDRAAARLAALMMAVFFFPVYYSREVYCYAQIIALTPLAVLFAIRIVFDGKRKPMDMALFLACLVVALYSHLGALMFAAALSACVLVLWLGGRVAKDADTTRGAFVAGVLCGLALLAVSPFIYRFVLQNKAHTAGSTHSFLTIVNDAVSKLFLGEKPWASALSWIVFLAGVASLVLRHRDSRPRRLLAGVTLLALFAIAWATHRSQYLSARYFSPVAPLVLIVMAQGVFQLAMWLARILHAGEPARRIVLVVLAAAPLAVHGFVYVPALLDLTEKSVPFGAVARWINENLPPGTPYLMESAYEIRWVGGTFPTPNHPPASPYVHGAGPQEMTRMHDRQIDFMTRFPEAPFIESAHHDWDKPSGIWTWPRHHFRRHTIVGNPEKLKRLIRMGIYPVEPHQPLSEYSYRIDIYFNTWEDRVEIARAEGQPALFAFEDWSFNGQPVSPQETQYFRFQRGHSGAFRVVNISQAPAQGTARLTVALPGPAGASATLQFQQGNQTLLRTRVPVGQSAVVEVPFGSLRPGDNLIGWQRVADGLGDGLILLDAKWTAAAP